MKEQTGWLIKGYAHRPNEDDVPVYTKSAQYIDGALLALKEAMQAGATEVLAVAVYATGNKKKEN